MKRHTFLQSSSLPEKQQPPEKQQSELNVDAATFDFEIELVVDTEDSTMAGNNDDAVATNVVIPFLGERLNEFDRQKFELERL